ncbi:fungal-specific transcription factor domain-containing protein [Aspergillus heterothallicus]
MGTDGLRRWGLNRFIFCPVQNTAPPNQDISPHIQLPTDLGSIFLELYFRRVHPLVPIVDYATISETWVQSNTASAVDIDPLNYHQLKLVLAIGAFVAGRSQGGDPDAGEKWAKILLKRATERIDLFSEISLAKIQFIVLRAVYAMHNCHVDEAYMYLGHAARCAIASGLNRSEITDEQQSNTHKMRLTFWVLYYLERQSSLFSGRQSAFQDDHIDTHFPEEVQYDSRTSAYPSPSIQCAWVRPMAELARVAGKVLTLSTPSTKSRTADLVTLVEVLQECEWLMRGIQNGLLPYLNFQHPAQPIGEEWQEVQRTHLGLMYHLTRVIMYRPLLQFRSLFPTVEDSQAFAAPSSANIQAGIASSIESSKLMIQLAYDVYSRRCPEVMYDTRIMSCSVYACVTLLYNILDPGPENDIAQVRETIDTVGLAVQCLNSVSNVRTAVAAQISTDIVDSVKAAWTAAGYTVDLDPGLIDILPWLIYFTPDGLFDPPAPS